MIKVQPTDSSPRSGATLTEVLMSMLIMSIGVSFVAAVFPLALLKSVQSNQLTHATILQDQAKSLIDMMPYRLHNPNGDPLTATPGNGFAADNPQTYTEHFNSAYLIDPWGYFIHSQDGSLADFPVPDEMLPPYGEASVAVPDLSGFPFGYHPTGFPGARSLLRYDGGIRGDTFTQPMSPEWEGYRERLAATLSTSSDRWNDTLETDDIVAVGPQSIELGSSVDLTGLAVRTALPPGALLIPDPEIVRITFFHEEGRASQSYPVTYVDGNVVHWGELSGVDFNLNGILDERNLPEHYFVGARPAGTTGFANSRISHVILETSLSRQFSWFLTVQKNEFGVAKVDAAIIFNRAVDPVNEHAFRATFRQGTNQVFVEYDPATEPEPFMKKGGYVFDANNAEWYRIRDIQEPGPGDYEAELTVEGPVRFASGEDSVDADQVLTDEDANGNGTLDPGEDINGNGLLDSEDRNRDGVFQYGTAIFLPGVIEVFPLGLYNLPEDVL